MGHNSQRAFYASEVYRDQNIFSKDIPNLELVNDSPATSALFDSDANTPPSSCLTTLDSSDSVPDDLDSQIQNFSHYILANRYPKTPPSPSFLVKHSCTSSIGSNEILSGLNIENLPSINHPNILCSVINDNYTSILSSSSSFIKKTCTSPTTSNCSEKFNSLNNQLLYYGSTGAYNFSNGGWNRGEICMQKSMDLDQKPPLLPEVNLYEHITPSFLSLPNVMINPDNVLCHGSECLGNQPWFQESQFEHEQKMGILDPTVRYFGSAIRCPGFTENAPDMEMPKQERSINIPTQIDQITIPNQGSVVKGNERKKKRMLKNRESAARSRAKKQASINYLENKIFTLKKENDLLNRELVFLRSFSRQLRHSSSLGTKKDEIS